MHCKDDHEQNGQNKVRDARTRGGKENTRVVCRAVSFERRQDAQDGAHNYRVKQRQKSENRGGTYPATDHGNYRTVLILEGNAEVAMRQVRDVFGELLAQRLVEAILRVQAGNRLLRALRRLVERA